MIFYQRAIIMPRDKNPELTRVTSTEPEQSGSITPASPPTQPPPSSPTFVTKLLDIVVNHPLRICVTSSLLQILTVTVYTASNYKKLPDHYCQGHWAVPFHSTFLCSLAVEGCAYAFWATIIPRYDAVYNPSADLLRYRDVTAAIGSILPWLGLLVAILFTTTVNSCCHHG